MVIFWQVEVNEMDNQQFIVHYNNDDVTSNLTNISDTLDYDTLSVTRKTTDIISIVLSTGVSVNATLRLGILSFTTVVQVTYMGTTEGLLGNFDDDKTNDFVNRNGSTIPYNSSDTDVFQFGQTCKEKLFMPLAIANSWVLWNNLIGLCEKLF